jgi:hypothetical protein
VIERFFECLLNKLYWEFRKESNLPFGSFSPEPVIKFSGFVLEEPYWNEAEKRIEVRRGWHIREPLLKMSDIPVYTRTIYLNKLFLHKQMGLQVFYESKEDFAKRFNAESLIEVICHELAHAILTDIDPKSQEVDGGHGKKHDEYTENLRKLLIGFSEYQELKKIWK